MLELNDVKDDMAKTLAQALGDKGPDKSGRMETFMQEESKEPEHQKSFADGNLQEFASEEEKEPEHQKSLQEDKDLVEWGQEEDAESKLKECIQLDGDNVNIKGCNFGNIDNLIKFLTDLKSSTTVTDKTKETVGPENQTAEVKVIELG